MAQVLDFCTQGMSRTQSLSVFRRIYPSYSLKRRVVRQLNFLNVCTIRKQPEAVQFLKHLEVDADADKVAYLFHKVHQNGRIYRFGYAADLAPVSVTKYALTEAACAGVRREHEVLATLKTAALPFTVPKVLGFQDQGNACALTMTAVDGGLEIHDKSVALPDRIFAAIAELRGARVPDMAKFFDLPWRAAAAQRVQAPVLQSVLQGIAPDTAIGLCAAHGDLGSENVFSQPHTREIFAVIDWEFFSEAAPTLTDRVGYWLGQRHRQFKPDFRSASGPALAEDFLSAFRDLPGGEAAAVAALLYLLSQGNDLAARLCGAAE